MDGKSDCVILPDQGERIELDNIPADRAEARDVSKEHPEIVARLTKMAKELQATLPEQPDATCISTADRGIGKPPGKKRAEK